MKKSVRQAITLTLTAATISVFAIADRFSVVGPFAQQSGSSDPKRDASNLIWQLAEGAVRVQGRAARLEAFARPNDGLSRERHAVKLAAIRAELDRIQEGVDRLIVFRRELEPWQQRTIDHMNAAVVGLADNLDVATGSLREGSDRTDYTEAIAAIYDWATYLKETASSVVASGEQCGSPMSLD